MRWLRYFVLAALIAAGTLVQAQETADDHLASLVDAETAFSALSVEKGMKVAFLAYLADDGIIYRPGPILGRDSWKKRSSPPGTLIWEPSYAEVSTNGDLGLSTGPWEYRPADSTGGETAYGQFVSVWRRLEEDGPWMVAVDLGISHPKPAESVGGVTFTPGPEHVLPAQPKKSSVSFSFGGMISGGGGGVGIGVGSADSPYDDSYHQAMASQMHRMMSAERTLAYELRSKDPGRAFPKLAASDVRVLRGGSEPVVGITEGAALAGTGRPHALEYRAHGHGVSGALDMGFSYGITLRTPQGASKPDTAGYLHVWRKDGVSGEWKLALDVESAYPKR
jgi:ketosteroid isomerase-like protein